MAPPPALCLALIQRETALKAERDKLACQLGELQDIRDDMPVDGKDLLAAG